MGERINGTIVAFLCAQRAMRKTHAGQLILSIIQLINKSFRHKMERFEYLKKQFEATKSV
jgi:hypothetical protein